MKELKAYEVEDMYGGAIPFAAIYLGIGAVLLTVSTLKILFAAEGKLKLPFGFEISFNDSERLPTDIGIGTEKATWNTNSVGDGSKTFVSTSFDPLVKC